MIQKDFLDVRLPKSIEERSKIAEFEQTCSRKRVTNNPGTKITKEGTIDIEIKC